ncbi:MAG: TIR domain-containing protein [Candidatus Aenigmatarchaeota archaeon]
MRIFISFSKEGIKYAEKVNTFFEVNGCSPFLATKNIAPGEFGWIRIGKEINSSDLIIFIITESSQSSTSQMSEISLSMNLGKHIISCVKDGIELSELIILEARNILKFEDSNLESICHKILSNINNGRYSKEIKPSSSLPEGKEV